MRGEIKQFDIFVYIIPPHHVMVLERSYWLSDLTGYLSNCDDLEDNILNKDMVQLQMIDSIFEWNQGSL